MSKVNLQNNEWCELVFENRNQAYGAYQLRNSYAKHTSKAFIFTLLFLVFGASIPLIAGFIGDITAPETAFKGDERIILVTLPPKAKIEETVIPELPKASTPPPTTRVTEYRIVPDELDAEIPPSNDEISKTAIGTQTTAGDPTETVD